MERRFDDLNYREDYDYEEEEIQPEQVARSAVRGGHQSASYRSSRDRDTTDLMRSKLGAVSQNSDRKQPDDLLSIIGNNLGNVSMQIRQDLGLPQIQELEHSPARSSLSRRAPKDDYPDEFIDIDLVKSLHEEFELEFEGRHSNSDRALVYLISQIDLSPLKYRVGALCHLYKAIYTLQLDRLEDIRSVQQAAIDLLVRGRHRDCPYVQFIALELIYFVGGVLDSEELCLCLTKIVSGSVNDDVKRKAVRLLFNGSTLSLEELIRLCSTEDEVSHVVSILLINEPTAIEAIIVPALLNHFHSTDAKIQSSALCALGRLGNLAGSPSVVNLLTSLINHVSVDKTLVIAALRAAGANGEAALNKIYKTARSSKTKSTICYILGKKVPPEFADHIEIAFYK